MIIAEPTFAEDWNPVAANLNSLHSLRILADLKATFDVDLPLERANVTEERADLAELPARPGEHLGLIGMRERAGRIGARLVVISALGRGSQVRTRLPLRS